MILFIILETDSQNGIDFYHRVIGGRIKRDIRFVNDPSAIIIRGLIIEIYMQRDYECSIPTLADETGIPKSIISRAATGQCSIKSINQVCSELEKLIERGRKDKNLVNDG